MRRGGCNRYGHRDGIGGSIDTKRGQQKEGIGKLHDTEEEKMGDIDIQSGATEKQ
jgi:hypothetical protein